MTDLDKNYIRMTYQKESQFCAAEITEEMIARLDKELVDVLHGCLGISGEVSEIHEAFLNVNFCYKSLDTVNLEEEVGDICWYIANISNALNYNANWLRHTTLVEQTKEYALASFFVKSIKMSVISGKIVDAVKRKIYYNTDLNKEELCDNVQELIKLVYGMAHSLGVKVETIHSKNIQKLTARYGTKFTEDAAKNRDLDAERKILEKPEN